MTRSEKIAMVEVLKEKFENASNFYFADSSALTVAEVNDFRRKCFEKGVEMRVVKNTLVRKAMDTFSDERNYAELFDSLKGPTTLMFCDTANVPAKLIEEFRKSHEKPVLKAAYIDTSVYLGDEQLKTLSSLKSKEELIGDIIGLLQSPAKNVISALKSGGSTIAGILKTLEERTEG